jgi:hypothetical protein
MNQVALDIGSYTHTRILEPHLVEAEYAIYPGVMKKGAKWEEFKANNEDKTILTKSQSDMVDKLVKNFESAKVILGKQGVDKEIPVRNFFENGKAEETLCGEIDGIKVKVRFDYRKEFEEFGSINDIKTTIGYIGTKESVEQICAQYDYDLAAALYVDLVTEETGKPHDWYYCFISKMKNNEDVRMFKASEQMLEKGRQKYKKAIQLLKEARKTGIYFTNVIEEVDSVELKGRK